MDKKSLRRLETCVEDVIMRTVFEPGLTVEICHVVNYTGKDTFIPKIAYEKPMDYP